jgi:hypothetical protein
VFYSFLNLHQLHQGFSAVWQDIEIVNNSTCFPDKIIDPLVT